MGIWRRPQGSVLTTISELAERVRSILVAGGVVFAETEARWIVEAAAGRGEMPATMDSRLVAEEARARAVALAERRAAGEPLQYVTGVAGFRHLELAVGPGVMIPRPETEIVTEQAMAKLPRRGVLVDCGTGSGAIALSVAQERPDVRVLATELSPAALRWAEKNRAALGLEVELIACDLLEGLPAGLRAKVDVVVSNPPYVPLSERRLLPRDVLEHEPHEALFGGAGGLEVIARLASEAIHWLRPGGWLVSEIGDGQAPEVRDLLEARGYTDVAVREDLTGRPRIVLAQRSP